MKKLILSNLKEFFEKGTFMPFSTLSELETKILESSELIQNVVIDDSLFILKGMKNNDGEQVIIYTFVK